VCSNREGVPAAEPALGGACGRCCVGWFVLETAIECVLSTIECVLLL